MEALSLYLGNWTPGHIRKDWDKCSMEPASAGRFLGGYAKDAAVIECVGWFDFEGSARVIVADLDNGRRIIVRLNARSTRIAFDRHGRGQVCAEASTNPSQESGE